MVWVTLHRRLQIMRRTSGDSLAKRLSSPEPEEIKEKPLGSKVDVEAAKSEEVSQSVPDRKLKKHKSLTQ